MRILVLNGPNLNMLGKRDAGMYGTKSLADVEAILTARAARLNVELAFFQSNSEGAMIDFIQKETPHAQGMIINPGALTHYGLSLHDALVDAKLPTIEVHLSNIYSREEWRQHSVVAPAVKGQISGLGWRGYVAALDILVDELRGND